ncbi:hypothetical protein KKG58_05680 [Patescibacteria group bacterium]|nr:hypothetical protein [Patescibacteria group bacterium]
MAKGFIKIKCGYCQGSGKDPFETPSKLSNCQVCQGRGEVLVKQPYETCSACKGNGRAFHQRLTCSVCNGRGVVPKISGRERKDGEDITGLPKITAYGLKEYKAKK